MRLKRTTSEDHFVRGFTEYLRAEVDASAFEVPGVLDGPEFAISTGGSIIGVELSQIPSKYIIRNFHRRRPQPVYTKNKIEGYLSIYPFEPHRWVHEVLTSKHEKVKFHKKRIKAEQMWLLMHCHSSKNEWPMSRRSHERSREAEALLMRFGTKGFWPNFERVFYIYADGTVVPLTGDSGRIPSAVMLPDGAGYPAVTHHQFSFGFDVPLPELGIRDDTFEDIIFSETVVPPVDHWMAGRHPEIERPTFAARAEVDSDRMEWKIFRNGNQTAHEVLDTNNNAGETRYMHFLLEWNIAQTTFQAKF